MTSQIQLRFKLLTGRIESIQISRAATVLDAKRQLHAKLSDAPPHRQKLILTGLGTILEDGRTLSSYPQINSQNSGTTIGIIIQLPWKIYVQDPTSKIYEVEIPSSEPLKYFISDLRALIETTMRQKLDDYQLQFKDTTIEDTFHGKKLTIQDWGIDKEDTIFLMKHGQSLQFINEPQVDICFLMDCTGSMGSWIESVKNNIKNVSDELDKQYRGCDLKFAFVRYTDYDRPESTRTTWIDFTKSLPQFHGFVNPIRADGGGDGPEDIMGGLKVACSRLSWRSKAAKVLIHIADCPCHGTRYHTLGDDYPNGDPAGITHDQMMSEIARLDLQYWFGYIQRETTDKMIDIFNESLKARSNHRLIIRQFSAVDPAQLESAIHKSTTASVFANEARKMFGGGATASFDTTEPNWATISEQHGIKTPPSGPKSLQNLQDGFKPEKPSVSFSVKVAPNPFSDGEESLVYRGYDTRNRRQVVLKKMKDSNVSLDTCMKVLEIQTICSTYAREFNENKKKPGHIAEVTFIPVDIAQMNDRTLYVVQPFISGKFEKYNTNNGIVCTALADSDAMQAFSHFTYVCSGESLLICDLQGVKTGQSFNLSDPAIHNKSRPRFYGNTDNGFLGIKRFFNSHVCNSICCQMNLDGVRL
jgi:hypothetical protein